MQAIFNLIKELLTGKTRLVLTIFAIAWSTATITIMLAVGEGLRLNFGKATSSIGKSFFVIQGGQVSSSSDGQSLNQRVLLKEQDLKNIVTGIPNIQVMPEYTFEANINYQNKTSNMQTNAINPAYAILRNIAVQPGGRFINDLDMQKNRHVIVLGTEFVKTLLNNNEKTNLLGKTIFIDQKPFLVIGIAKEKPITAFYQPPDNYLAWIPASTYIADKNPNEINYLLIFPQNNSLLIHLKKQITQLIARNHYLDPKDENIVQIIDVSEEQKKTQTFLIGTEIFLGLVGAMTLIVASVGVANVMFISVKRATREIGIRMAIGARSWQILWRYILESLLTTFIGGLLGMTVAYVLVFLVNQIPLTNEMFKYIGKPTPVLSNLIIIIVIFTLGAVGLLAGFFPARHAANINPAEALRYE